MKNLLVKKWKNIFIAIGVAIIALVLYNKISWQPNIVNSYIESDINIKSDVIDGIKGTTENVTGKIEDAANNQENNTGVEIKEAGSPVTKWVVAIVVAFIVLLVLDLIMQGGSGKSDKKK